MLDPSLVRSLGQIVGRKNVLDSASDLDRYSTDALTPFRAFRAASQMEKTADLVVMPHSAAEVGQVVCQAVEYGVPIVPYGGGTGVMGATLPVHGGIVLDLKGLNRVLEVNVQDRSALVEGGIILGDLAEALGEHGLMLGHDPWSVPIATVGGAVSTNGVGYLAAAYGPIGRQVLGLEVVLPTGQLLTTPSVTKYSSGPNLNHLFIGSEGAFGIITKATLRVFRQPERRSFSTIGFDSFECGFKAVSELFALGVHPALMDLTEERGKPVLLYLMFEGYREGVGAQQRRSLKLCLQFGGRDLGPGQTQEYWKERYDIAKRYQRNVQGLSRKDRWQDRGWMFDYLHVALPISKVLEYRQRSADILAEHRTEVREWAIWGHPEFLSLLIAPVDGDHEDTGERLAKAVDLVLRLAQDMGGTMEYCHGVGVKLAHLIGHELGVGLEVVHAMKRALDPANIMNPGKLGLSNQQSTGVVKT